MKNRVEELINKNNSFAIVQYFEWLKGAVNEKNKIYELLTIKEYKGKKEIDYKKLTEKEIEFLKININKLKVKTNTPDGIVYDFNNFKQILQKNNIKNIT